MSSHKYLRIKFCINLAWLKAWFNKHIHPHEYFIGCLSTSFSRLERDARRREAFSLYWDSNAFALDRFSIDLAFFIRMH